MTLAMPSAIASRLRRAFVIATAITLVSCGARTLDIGSNDMPAPESIEAGQADQRVAGGDDGASADAGCPPESPNPGAASGGGTGGLANPDVSCVGSTTPIEESGTTAGSRPCTASVLYADDFADPATLSNYDFPYGLDYQITDGVLRQTAHPATSPNGNGMLINPVDAVALIQSCLLGGVTDYVVDVDARIHDRTGDYGLFGVVARGSIAGNDDSFVWGGNIERAVPAWIMSKRYFPNTPGSYCYFGADFTGGPTEPAYAVGNWVHLTMQTVGSRLRAWVDLGTGPELVYDVIDRTASPFTTGSAGVRSGWLQGANTVEFDNLRVSASCE